MISHITLVEWREWIAFVVECLILLVVWMEYQYDKRKDEVKKHRTRTTKKTVTEPGGKTTTEEEHVSEPYPHNEGTTK